MAEQRYVFKESTIKAIIDIPRTILDIPEDQKFSPADFPNMINEAVGYVASQAGESGYQGGLAEGYENGYGEGYSAGNEAGYNSGREEGKEQGKLELVQSSENLYTKAYGKTLDLNDVSPIEHNLEVKLISKNAIPFPYVSNTKTESGVTLTVNNDGSVTIDGTASTTIYYILAGGWGQTDMNHLLEDGQTYVLSLSPSNANMYFILSYVEKSTGSEKYLYSGANFTVDKSLYDYSNLRIQISGGQSNSNITVYPQLEFGIKPTEYVPYIDVTSKLLTVSDGEQFKNFTPNNDGTVDGVTSKYTYLTTNNDNVIIGCRYISDIDKKIISSEDVGKKKQYDEFWNSYQDHGRRTGYPYAFAGDGWTDDTFKPKYDIILATGYSGTSMFWSIAVTNMAEAFSNQGVVLDTTKCGYMNSMFQNTKTTRIPVLNCTHAMDYSGEGLYYTFNNAPNLETIDKLIVTENLKYTSTFFNCPKLKNIIFEGVIGQDISFRDSPLLTKDTILSIMTHLSETSSGKTVTIPKTAINNAFETSVGAADGSTSAEWLALTGTRTNWTIALA